MLTALKNQGFIHMRGTWISYCKYCMHFKVFLRRFFFCRDQKTLHAIFPKHLCNLIHRLIKDSVHLNSAKNGPFTVMSCAELVLLMFYAVVYTICSHQVLIFVPKWSMLLLKLEVYDKKTLSNSSLISGCFLICSIDIQVTLLSLL